MKTTRKIMVFSLLVFIVGGHGICLIGRKEPWPFSCYPMYSHVPKPPLFALQLRGVGPEPELGEFVLPNTYLFRPPSIYNSLSLILRRKDTLRTDKLNRVLSGVSKMYERGRVSGTMEIPKIETIRLYRRSWALNLGPDAIEINQLPEELIHEFSIYEVAP